VVGVVLEVAQNKVYGVLANQNYFFVEIHTKFLFPNIKLLEKPGNFFIFKNLQLLGYDKIKLDEIRYMFILRSNENSAICNSSVSYKDELNTAIAYSKDKSKWESLRYPISVYLQGGTEIEECMDEDDLIETLLQQESK